MSRASGRIVAAPAFRREPQYQRDSQNSDARQPGLWQIGALTVTPHDDSDRGEDDSRQENAIHSGLGFRSVNLRMPALKSSVARASMFVTTPAAMPSSKDNASSL